MPRSCAFFILVQQFLIGKVRIRGANQRDGAQIVLERIVVEFRRGDLERGVHDEDDGKNPGDGFDCSHVPQSTARAESSRGDELIPPARAILENIRLSP